MNEYQQELYEDNLREDLHELVKSHSDKQPCYKCYLEGKIAIQDLEYEQNRYNQNLVEYVLGK